jgi:uncharacterized protein (DUF885 family)
MLDARRTTIRAIVLAIVTIVPVTAGAQRAPGERVNALATELMMTALRRQPELATLVGLPGFRHDRLGDNALAAIAAGAAEDDDWRARVMAIAPADVAGTPDGITLGFLREAAEGGLQRRACRDELWAGVNQLGGWHLRLTRLAAVQPVGTDDLRAQALARFAEVPRVVDAEIANLREGVRLGYSAPQVNVRRVLEQLDQLLATDPAASPFAAPAQRDSTPDFVRDLTTLVADRIHPAVARYRAFLADEYLPAARVAHGVAANPDGAACYRAAVRSYSSLDVPAEEIHRIGLEQMALIRSEMREIAVRSFGTGDVSALLERFRTDPEFLFTSREEIVRLAEGAIERGREAMPRWFGRLPAADVVVEPYREFEERSAPGASYELPSADGSRPGLYRINTYQPETQSRVGVESTAFHEAIPGHHLQLAIAQERDAAHMITRYLGNSGFSEGWGLYAERLADEMGLFSSDLDRMGLLSNEALRAARMVVDPALHVLGWTREQAIDYMLENTAENRVMVENEVDRYIGWPGQATAYMLGNLEIRRLRAMAEERMGESFDIREFHDRVLEDGTVPLPMLRAKIDAWSREELTPPSAASPGG